MEGVVRRRPYEQPDIDTYANLLYKAGRKEEAILWEEKAVRVAKKRDDESGAIMYQKVIAKMENGEPTWLVLDEKKDQKQ